MKRYCSEYDRSTIYRRIKRFLWEYYVAFQESVSADTPTSPMASDEFLEPEMPILSLELLTGPHEGHGQGNPNVNGPTRPIFPYQGPQNCSMPLANKNSSDLHSICRDEIERLRRQLRTERSATDLPPGRKVTWAPECYTDYDDCYKTPDSGELKALRRENRELRKQLERRAMHTGQSSNIPYPSGGMGPSIQGLSDQAILNVPPDFWRKFVTQSQELLNENRRLYQELHHLKCTHGGGNFSCPPTIAPACPTQQYDSLPNLNSTFSHAECDRRNAELEDEIDRLKRERSKLRMQGDAVKELTRAISQKQAALRQDISQYQALERENATQRELLMKLANERDSMVQVLKERDRSFAGLLGSIKQHSGPTRRNTCDLIAKERELESLIGKLAGMSENRPRSPCENAGAHLRANENGNGVPYESECRPPYPVN